MLDNTVFVFGSNTAGRHGKGAALHAVRYCGAKYGVGEGLQGRSYALPTRDGSQKQVTSLSLEQVGESVARFLDFARQHPELTFQVTRVGCGLGDFRDEQIFPMFVDAPKNCWLPGIWEAKRTGVQRVVVAGSRTLDDYDLLERTLDAQIEVWGLKKPVIVSGTAKGADRMGEQYAAARGLDVVKFPGHWNTLGRAAGILRNVQMAWYGTHAAVFWDGVSNGSRHMIETAKESRLRTLLTRFTPKPQLEAGQHVGM